MDINKKQFLKEYKELCSKHNIFINFFPTDAARLEPNPNEKGNETNKEWTWFALMEESFKDLEENS